MVHEYWNPCTMQYSTSVCSFGHPSRCHSARAREIISVEMELAVHMHSCSGTSLDMEQTLHNRTSSIQLVWQARHLYKCC